MGQGLSFGSSREEEGVFGAVRCGDVDTVRTVLEVEPSVLDQTTGYGRNSTLHIAAANGQIEILAMLLERSLNPDVLNRHKQTPLMLAAMHGKISCVRKLIESGANILSFDSLNGRTCLHYAVYYGQTDCVQAILSAAQSSPIAVSWGYSRFVNIRDEKGDTPLHLAARQRRPECVHLLLGNGALVCASTSGYGSPGSTPLHLAARGGSIDCIRKLLAWGADRFQRDSSGRIPYAVALQHKHRACAALLNPSSAEPLVWPSPLKFISDLNDEAKALLEEALMEANLEREKNIFKGPAHSLPSPSQLVAESGDDMSEESDSELCSICFEQICTIELKDCNHQMCAQCMLSLCCHNKPNPNPNSSTVSPSPVCPFCRSTISRLAVISIQNQRKTDDVSRDVGSPRTRRSRSSSFKGLYVVGSTGKMTGYGFGMAAVDSEFIAKP